MTLAIIIDLLTIAGIFVFGGVVLKAVWDGWDWIETLALAFPLGAGLLTWCLFMFSWTGMPYTPTTLIVQYLVLLGIVAIIFLVLRKTRSGDTQGFRSDSHHQAILQKRHLMVLIPIGILTILAAIFAVGRSYSTWDAIVIWGVKGYGMVEGGTILSGRSWGAYGLSYPWNIPIQISFFRLLDGDVLPGSKLLFPMYFAALLLGSYTFLYRHLEWKFAVLGTLFLGTIPFLFEHATIGYANLPFTCYLVLGILLSLDGMVEDEAPRQFIGGILLGLAVWTRPEGIFLVLTSTLAIISAARFILKRKIRWMAWLLPAVIISVSWLVITSIFGNQNLFSSSVLSMVDGWSGLDLKLDSVYWIARFLARQSIELKVWGLMMVIIVFLFIMNIRKLIPRKYPFQASLLLITIVLGATVAVYYYLVSYTRDLHYLLGTSVNRLFMPMWVLAVLWAVMLAGEAVDAPLPKEEGNRA
jgi:hypothetical protein